MPDGGRTGRYSSVREGIVPAMSKGRKQPSRCKMLAVELGNGTEHRMCIGGNEAASIGRSMTLN